MARVAEAARALGIPSGSHYMWPGVQSGEAMTTHLAATSRTGYAPSQSYEDKSYGDVLAIYTKGRFGMIHTPFFASLVGDDPKMLDDPRITTLFTPRDQAILRGAAAPTPAQRAQMRRIGATLLAIVHGGGTLGLGTDAPLGVPGISLQLGARSLVAGGFTPVEAQRTQTTGAPEVRGVDRDIGTIAPGKLADLVFVDGDPTVRIDDLYRVDKVMKAGRLYTQADIAAGFAQR
jgi:hypothetical protein